MNERRAGLLTAGGAVVLAAVVAPAVIASRGPWLAAADVLTGSMVIVLGVIGSLRRPRSWTGPLLAAAGVAWFLADLGDFPGALGALGALTFLHRAVIVHAIFSVPDGRLATTRARLAILAVYGVSLLPMLWTNPIATIGGAIALIVASVVAAVRSPGRERHARAFGAWAGGVFGAAMAFATIVRAFEPSPSATAAAILVYESAFVAAAALVLTAALVRQGVVADDVIEEADTPGRTMQDAVAWAVGDRALRLGRPDSAGRFVDPDGRPVEASEPGRELRIVRDGEHILAQIDIAQGALESPDLPLSLDAAIRLDAGNADLRAGVSAQVERLAASRRRLLSAADDEERRLEQRLSRGAGMRLARIGRSLDTVAAAAPDADRPAIEGLQRMLRSAEHLVVELSAGIYPAALAAEGLNAVLARTVAHFPIPVSLTSDVAELSQETALAAYYVVQEGLANAARHARATHLEVAVHAGDELAIVVTDDGIGGADTQSGLGGLRDRVAALGGSIALTSPVGVGTTLRAVLPLSGVPA